MYTHKIPHSVLAHARSRGADFQVPCRAFWRRLYVYTENLDHPSFHFEPPLQTRHLLVGWRNRTEKTLKTKSEDWEQPGERGQHTVVITWKISASKRENRLTASICTMYSDTNYARLWSMRSFGLWTLTFGLRDLTFGLRNPIAESNETCW